MALDTIGQIRLNNKDISQIDFEGNTIWETSVTPYTPLNYIESTGTQYINTLYNTTNGFKADLKINIKIFGNGQSYIIGSYINGVRSYLGIYSYVTYLGLDTDTTVTPTLEQNTDLVIEMSTTSGNGYINVNGVNRATTSKTYTQTSVRPLYLMAVNQGYSTLLTNMSGRLYYCKIYDNDNNLVRDFIPVLDKNNVPCLFDKLNKVYYYNAGSGTFNYGLKEE